MGKIEKLDYNIFAVDMMEEGKPNRSSCFIIRDEKTAIVETGTSPSVPVILDALKELNIPLEDIDIVVVTHIHLDHSGGAGLLLESLPNAKIFVHERGAKHLIDPSVLEKSSRAVYGEDFDRLFAPIKGIPENRVEIKKEGDSYSLGSNRELKFYDSPGHALHHLFIHDTGSNGIFTGDSGGILYRDILDQHNVKFVFPTSTPTQFDPEAMSNTLDKMMSLKPEYIYFTHFSRSDNAVRLLEQVKNWLPVFSNEALAVYNSSGNWEAVADFFRDRLHQYLLQQGVPKDSPALESLELDIRLNALGIESYAKRLEKMKNK